jgi:hypothetical protein
MTPAGRALVPELRRFARSADALKNKAKRIALTGAKPGVNATGLLNAV